MKSGNFLFGSADTDPPTRRLVGTRSPTFSLSRPGVKNHQIDQVGKCATQFDHGSSASENRAKENPMTRLLSVCLFLIACGGTTTPSGTGDGGAGDMATSGGATVMKSYE